MQSIRARVDDGGTIYVILDNLNHHKGPVIRAWCEANRVEPLYTPTYASWANPIEARFGPLRQFVIANSDHPNHQVLARAIHRYLTWRNGNRQHPRSTHPRGRTTPPRPHPQRTTTTMGTTPTGHMNRGNLSGQGTSPTGNAC